MLVILLEHALYVTGILLDVFNVYLDKVFLVSIPFQLSDFLYSGHRFM